MPSPAALIARAAVAVAVSLVIYTILRAALGQIQEQLAALGAIQP